MEMSPSPISTRCSASWPARCMRDAFVFFLAGHGKTIDGRYYYVPQDFRYEGEQSIVDKGIDQARLQAWFAQIPARRSVLLFDTCESGTLTGEKTAQRGLERVAALDRMTQAMGRTVLSASTAPMRCWTRSGRPTPTATARSR